MKRTTRWSIALLVLIVVGTGVAYLLWSQPDDAADQMTVPSNQQTATSEPGPQTFTSAKGITITLDNWPKDGVVASPLTITGKVPGNWSSEGEFPIDVVHEGDIGLPGTTAHLEGDWMTEAMVPFTATLTFDEQTMKRNDVTIILRKANPSGQPDKDDSLALKVRFTQ